MLDKKVNTEKEQLERNETREERCYLEVERNNKNENEDWREMKQGRK